MSNFRRPNPEHPLFNHLVENKPIWWQNLLNDKELYINIRQDDHINVYHSGGSLLKLSFKKSFIAEISFEYVPLTKFKDYITLEFKNNDSDIFFPDMKTLALDNFGEKALSAVKSRIRRSFGPETEKGIQADFVLNNGCFIDTEFQPVSSSDTRFDLVWVDVKRKKIFVIELKTHKDKRLSFNPDKDESIECEGVGNIYKQLKKYHGFIEQHAADILEYYQAIFQIEKKLGVLPSGLTTIAGLNGFNIEPKPILLVGDCTQRWITDNAVRVNTKLKDIAYGCFYQGKSTRDFKIPEKTQGYRYIFHG
jgi:hypothetical protein